MTKSKINYLKCIVIIHGKSEYQICQYIKSNLRLHMKIIGKNHGNNSIQITSIHNVLNDSRFNSFKNFIAHFDDVEDIKKTLASYFKIFIIMDTDDCTLQQKESYISKAMFKKHWAYNYIVPIFNSDNLETVLKKAGIKFEKKGDACKGEYIKIFPTDKKYLPKADVELEKFCNDLKKVKDTNLDLFIESCLKYSDEKG